MEFFLNLLFSGIAIGSIYALIAHGFNVTFRTMKMVNFGYGSFMMISVFIALTLFNSGLNLFVAMFLAVIVNMIFGVTLERLAVRPLLKIPGSHGWLVSTLGAGIILQALATMIWGSQAYSFPTLLFKTSDVVEFFTVRISLQQLLIIGTAIIVMMVLDFIMEKTLWGRSMKATAYDNEYAQLVGINTKLVTAVSFAISALLASIAGLLVAPITGISPAFGLALMLKGFVAVIIGGMGSSKGALIGGMAVGILEMMVNGYISSQLGTTVVFAFLIVALIIRPTGIFGKVEVVKV
jgi:branched-chain amino acid transport system permease protein